MTAKTKGRPVENPLGPHWAAELIAVQPGNTLSCVRRIVLSQRYWGLQTDLSGVLTPNRANRRSEVIPAGWKLLGLHNVRRSTRY